MTEIRIDALEINNFKGLKEYTLKVLAEKYEVQICGRNASGKTTLMDAFTWLLFDKDSHGRSDFAIKPLDPSGKPVHGVDVSVKAALQIDGAMLTLKKIFREKWTKKRGEARKTFTGHQTKYEIDGVPAKKSEYTQKIKEIADTETFRLLTDPCYFPEKLHWEKRREILLQVCGDVSDADVIASADDLKALPGILGDHSLNDYQKIIAGKRKELNKSIEAIPTRIDEATRALPDVSGLDADQIKETIKSLQGEINENRQELEAVKNGGKVAELRLELSVIEQKIQELYNHYSKTDPSIREALNQAEDEFDQITRQIRSLLADEEQAKARIKALQSEIEELRQRWFEIDSKKFQPPETDGICPTCKQPVPAAQIESTLKEAEAQFNQDKAHKLEHINSQGMQKKQALEDAQALITDIASRVAGLRKNKEELEEKIATLRKGTDPDAQRKEIEELQQYKALNTQRAGLLRRIEMHSEDAKGEAEKIQSKIDALEQKLADAKEQMAAIKLYEKGTARIKELKDEERRLAAELEKLEGHLHLCEEFIRQKVTLLEDKINRSFKIARFKLFETQINGGLKECCEVMAEGVPYGSLNNAMRINTGLDIINTLSGHYGLVLPVWIDNAESVTDILPTRAQQIQLYVDADCSELTVTGD